jgi:2-oxoglutarate dehydrogenase E2 component (dihydrolipoamide succinyltransferase)
VLSALLVPEGQTVSVGTALAVIDEPGKARSLSVPTGPAAGRSAEVAAAPPERTGGPIAHQALLSPVVRKLLSEHRLDPSEILGTGAEGRITRKDILDHLEKRKAGRAPGGDRMVPLNRIRKRTAEQMALSWRTIPHVLQAVEVDFHAVEQARAVQAEAWGTREGWSLSYLPFVAHAVCTAIADFPMVNAKFEGDSLLLHARVNLGIAVDLGEDGLIAPVLKDAHQKVLPQLAREIRALIEKARDRRLAPDDLTEATYTLSNSGSFGTLLTAPIINPPQVAILSIDGVTKRPVVLAGPGGDAVAIRPVGVLAQSFDHRAFDGAYSAGFLRRLKSILETRDWSTMLGGGESVSSARPP